MSKFTETLTISEVAKILGCNRVTIWRRVQEGIIPGIRIPGRKRPMWRILKSDLAKILDSRIQGGGGE